MAHRIEVTLKGEYKDSAADSLVARLRADFGFDGVSSASIIDVYVFEDNLAKDELARIGEELLADPLTQTFAIDSAVKSSFSIGLEISYRPGVKDSVGETAKEGAEDVLGRKLEGGVYASKLYLFEGEFPDGAEKKVAEGILCNPLIQDWKAFHPQTIFTYYSSISLPKAGSSGKGSVFEIPLDGLSDAELEKLSRRRLLALNLDEMKAVADYFASPKTISQRKKAGLGEHPTDAELECIAQTWSEHCKHKIFNAKINYVETGAKGKKKTKRKETINSLFKTCIRATTEKVGKKINYLVSVFEDNAGVIKFDSDYNIVMKVETHNTPSALDPYGGALTGILGVNRDVIAVGIGAKPIFNTDIFCFADPFYSGKIPPRLLHPRRVFEGVRAGVERGGNASGIPTVNGSIFFDDRYLGKPIVYCGTGGIMPARIGKVPSHTKPIMSGHRIFSVGGRIGKDGIHGATFSSEGLHESSPTSAVQLGDPFTQKKALDFILEARDAGLISGMQDMGAGGLSSSVGEMALITNGAILHLDRALLKYPGPDPWEILVSESQERFMVAVPPAKAGEFAALANMHSVEASDVGEFNSTGFFHVLYHDVPVLCLSLKFLHHGLPKMELEAEWEGESAGEMKIEGPEDLSSALLALLARPNICSKESVVRQYDHEVMGMSVVKPMCGKNGTGPSDAAVLQPFAGKQIGIVVSHGMAVHAGDIDPYHMAMLAVDEAVRNYIATGGNPAHWGGLDNFCWPDPIKSQSNPDGARKLGALVRANRGLAEACIAYSLPLISGKDSMKNDYRHGEWKISVPPTLLVSIMGKINDCNYACTTDFKNAGDRIYVLGVTKDELGGSEYYAMHNSIGANVPKVDLRKNHSLYTKLHRAISSGIVASAHDVSDGGIAVALAECCIGGKLGAHADLTKVPQEGGELDGAKLLFSESAGRFIVSVHSGNAVEFEKMLAGSEFARIGEVSHGGALEIKSHGGTAIKCDIDSMEKSFKGTITW